MESSRVASVPTVAVVGASLLLEGIAANLARCEEIKVLQITADVDEAAAWLSGAWPIIIIFELDSLYAELLCDRLTSSLRPLLVGLDFSNNRIVVVDGQEYSAPNIEDLRAIVLGAVRNRGELSKGGFHEGNGG